MPSDEKTDGCAPPSGVKDIHSLLREELDAAYCAGYTQGALDQRALTTVGYCGNVDRVGDGLLVNGQFRKIRD